MIFMVIVGVFLLYLVAGYFVYQLFLDLGIKKNKALVAVALLMVVVPFGDVLPGKLYLKYVCETDAGINIGEKVIASGYSVGDRYLLGCGATCVDALVKWHSLGKDMYIESEIFIAKDGTFGLVANENVFERPKTVYRFELLNRTSEICSQQDYIKNKYPGVFESYRIPAGYCVYGKIIDKPLEKYIVHESKWDRSYSKVFGISSVRTFVEEADTGNIIGSNTGFIHRGGWLRRWVAEAVAVGPPDECIEDGSYGFSWTVLRGVFND